MERTRIEIERWLAAEAAGDEDAAEAAFGAATHRLPRLAPRAGFSQRVAWAVRPEPARARVRVRWAERLGLAAALSLAGLAVAFLPALRALPIDLPRPSALIDGLARSVAWVGGRLGAGLEVWDTLSAFGRAIGAAAATPEAISALAASVALGFVGFTMLHHLLTLERSTIR